MTGRISIAEQILQKGIDINHPEILENAKFCYCSENIDSVKFLVRHGINVNYTNKEEKSPLYFALEAIAISYELEEEDYKEREIIIKYLIHSGAKIHT